MPRLRPYAFGNLDNGTKYDIHQRLAPDAAPATVPSVMHAAAKVNGIMLNDAADADEYISAIRAIANDPYRYCVVQLPLGTAHLAFSQGHPRYQRDYAAVRDILQLIADGTPRFAVLQDYKRFVNFFTGACKLLVPDGVVTSNPLPARQVEQEFRRRASLEAYMTLVKPRVYNADITTNTRR